MGCIVKLTHYHTSPGGTTHLFTRTRKIAVTAPVPQTSGIIQLW
jgi:hypothetical protein